ncbi:TolC family protein [bacterium CPR1]|nr:TolC family protein [bacterium CPR1]
MARILWLILLVLVLFPSALAQEGLLTLEQAIELAMQGNRKMQSAHLAVERNDHLLRAAEAQRLPSISLQANHQRQLEDQSFVFQKGSLGTYSIGPIPSQDTVVAVLSGSVTTFQAQVAQPLTGLYRLNLGVDLQQGELDVAREEERLQRLQTILEVRSAYYALLDAQAGLVAARDGAEFLAELERVTGELVREKVALRADLLEVQARRLEAQAQVLQLENAFQTRCEQLNLLLGRDLATRFSVADPTGAQPPCPDLASLQQAALSVRPELRQALIRIRQAEQQRDLKAAEWIPEINLAFQYQRFSDSGILPDQAITLGLQAEWEAWDWGRRGHQAAAQSAGLEEARRAEAAARDQVVLEVNASYRRLSEARAGESAARVARDAAEERLRVATSRFLLKAALLKDVLEAQAQLSRSQREHRKIVLDCATAEAELERAVGHSLLEEEVP